MRKIEEIFKPEYISGNRKQFTKELKKEGYDIVSIRWYDWEDYVEIVIGNTPDNPYRNNEDVVIGIYQPYYSWFVIFFKKRKNTIHLI